MRRVLAVVSGRADAAPMRPVFGAIKGCQSSALNVETPWRAAQLVGEMLAPTGADCMLVLGDRYEILGACLAATYHKIPIAHIHGGEASFGSFDNQIRDAITKLAHIHFVAAEPMKQRLLALGEEEHRIHVVGAPGLDNLADALAAPRKPQKYFVVTWHPETLGDDSGLDALITTLRHYPDYTVVWTGVNNDPGASEVERKFIAAGIRVSRVTPNVYLQACRHAAAVVGNSSSGIIEAPYLEVPTVNIGSRQDGRLKGRSIYDCGPTPRAIEDGIICALLHGSVGGPGFDRLYGEPGASRRIADILANTEIDMVKRWAS